MGIAVSWVNPLDYYVWDSFKEKVNLEHQHAFTEELLKARTVTRGEKKLL